MADVQPQTANPAQDRSFFQKLKDGEHLWAWKASFRIAVCVLDIIGIGCAAWLVSVQRSIYYMGYDYFDYFMLPGSLTALSVSLTWCLIVLLVYLLRRPPSPVHPGICVGIDLILWLVLIVTGLFTIGAVFSVSYFGSDAYIDDPSYSFHASEYDGHYILSNNGTWVYKITYVDNPCDYDYTRHGCHYNYTTGTYTTNRTAASVHRKCGPYFSSCAQQDTYINHLWQQKPLIEGLEIMSAAAQWFGVLFHFILFVWACVDTHRYNAKTKSTYTAEIAERVIRDMEARGLITVNSTASARTDTTEMATMTPVVRPLAAERQTADEDEIGQAR